MRKTDSRQSLLHFSPNRSPEASPQLPERLNLGSGATATTLRINTDGDTLLPPRDPRSDDSIELGGMLLFAPPKAKPGGARSAAKRRKGKSKKGFGG